MGIKRVTLGPLYSHLKAEGMRIPRGQRGFLLLSPAQSVELRGPRSHRSPARALTGQLCPPRVCGGAGSAVAGWTGLVSLPGV